MNSDLSDVKVGDFICTTRGGWEKVAGVNHDSAYPVSLVSGRTCTLKGLRYNGDKYPSVYIEPPEGWKAGPRPSQLKKGDRVLVAAHPITTWYRRYFSHMSGKHYHCFSRGCDEWASKGKTSPWSKCEKCVEE